MYARSSLVRFAPLRMLSSRISPAATNSFPVVQVVPAPSRVALPFAGSAVAHDGAAILHAEAAPDLDHESLTATQARTGSVHEDDPAPEEIVPQREVQPAPVYSTAVENHKAANPKPAHIEPRVVAPSGTGSVDPRFRTRYPGNSRLWRCRQSPSLRLESLGYRFPQAQSKAPCLPADLPSPRQSSCPSRPPQPRVR